MPIEEVLDVIATGAQGTVIDTLVEPFKPLLLKVGVFLGGVGLLYLVLIGVRVYYEREKVHILKDLRYNQIQLNKHYGVRYTKHKPNILRRMGSKIKNKFISIRMHSEFHKKIKQEIKRNKK